MSYYNIFQKTHPAWPKTLREAKFRRIKLLRDLMTWGGVWFSAETVMKIVGSWRSCLNLMHDKNGAYIRMVSLYNVEMLPDTKKYYAERHVFCPRCKGHHYKRRYKNPIFVNTVGGLYDKNPIKCECCWNGVVHDLVSHM